MITFTCPSCHESVQFSGIAPESSLSRHESDAASNRLSGPPPARRKPGRKPKPKPPAPQELANAAVHNWLVYGRPAFGTIDGGSIAPWGQQIPAADVFSTYTDWAFHNGVRLITARPLYQALTRFGVRAERDGTSRYHVFPEVPNLGGVPPCPRLQPVDKWPFPPRRLPWVEGWLAMSSGDPDGPWATYLSVSEGSGWVNVERLAALAEGLYPPPSWWPAAAPEKWFDAPVAAEASEDVTGPAGGAGGGGGEEGPGVSAPVVGDGGRRRSVFAVDTVAPPVVWP